MRRRDKLGKFTRNFVIELNSLSPRRMTGSRRVTSGPRHKDGVTKKRAKISFAKPKKFVIPAQAGIQKLQD